MGFETFGFAFGREDVWEPDEIFWGPEDTWLGDERYSGERDLSNPLGAVQMGLIYVNPEGPNGNPDPLAAAHDIRETFARMAMDDEETVALIVGGHSFGKCHGAGDPDLVGPEPEGCPVTSQGLGWKSSFGTGVGTDAITSGLEGAWTNHPTQWDNGFLDNLYGYEWELTESPAGAKQWKPTDPAAAAKVPDAQDPAKRHAPMMLTTDLALRMDPIYAPITKRFHEHPDELAVAFAKAWYKLLHRDMGPVSRFLGPWVPEPQLWQDPVPAVDHELVDDADVATLKRTILGSGLSPSQLVGTAWAAAASFRGTDKRGGANGARLRLAPQKDWEVNEPAVLSEVLPKLEQIQKDFNDSQANGKRISLADVIVLAGSAAVEHAAHDAGLDVTVPFAPGRTDASQEQTDVDAFAVLEPIADGFRNYQRPDDKVSAETRLLDRANLLGLTAAEMTVLVGGMRALDANCERSSLGVLTDRPGKLTGDFFVHLLAAGTAWKTSAGSDQVYEGRDVESGEVKWTRERGGSGLRLELGPPLARRGLRGRRRERVVRPRLRRGLGQGHEPGPLRSRGSTHRCRPSVTRRDGHPPQPTPPKPHAKALRADNGRCSRNCREGEHRGLAPRPRGRDRCPRHDLDLAVGARLISVDLQEYIADPQRLGCPMPRQRLRSPACRRLIARPCVRRHGGETNI